MSNADVAISVLRHIIKSALADPLSSLSRRLRQALLEDVRESVHRQHGGGDAHISIGPIL